jgi:class 3 adenylate cyclase
MFNKVFTSALYVNEPVFRVERYKVARSARRKTPPASTRPSAVVIFTDIRGFSRWSEHIDSHESTDLLVSNFQSILRKHFNGYLIKPLGDGAMMVVEKDFASRTEVLDALEGIVEAVAAVESEFEELTSQIQIKFGNPTNMTLGWGVTRGHIIKTLAESGADYLGHHINKAARLCEIARPRGMVIDREDFPERPTKYRTPFFEQVRKIEKSREQILVWVSQEINEEFQAREKLRETPEVHVAGVCVRETGVTLEVFLAQRSPKRSLYAEKWEGCGGQLRHSELFHEGVERHYRTEMKLEVHALREIAPEIYQIGEPDEPRIPGLRFLCLYRSREPFLANHTEFRWVSEEKLASMLPEEFPPGLQAQALSLIKKFRNKQVG